MGAYLQKLSAIKNNTALLIAVITLLIGLVSYWGGLTELLFRWNKQEEYGHGYFIPLITIWFLWERKAALIAAVSQGSYWGVGLLLFASFLLLTGEVTAFYLAIQLGFILFLMSITLAYGGRSLFKLCFTPIFFLVFCIPLPYFMEALLTARLQLLSSEFGVMFLRAIGTSVYLEGNVIDLGQYQLQVVEACSGLRYLYPLMGIAFLIAYMYQAAIWKKGLVFISSIPITVVMNSVRIAVVGVLVDHWGSEMADGFLHYFEGWIVFMICLGILVAEVWILERMGSGRNLMTAIDTPKVGVPLLGRSSSLSLKPLWAAFFFTLITCGITLALSDRVEIQPPHKPLDTFPLSVNGWVGEQGSLGKNELSILGLQDYLLADYFRPEENKVVNYYLAYYASQRKGVSPHSPQVCMPGGGWVIASLERIPMIDSKGKKFTVNKVLIKKGQDKQVVYYWYQQRGRKIASEYLMKFYLFKDAIFMNRTDGALVRLVTNANDDVAAADKRLSDFIKVSLPLLNDYIPE
ncbi:VPLPA-CTERM-specific exosortase XrtD [Methylophilus aquaticus]|uniref:VPLPA-CTERM-specific exosortase XrtD n=1 Tax=Methylophilus aquaticus TaxID=1971610 RepID=A0ABT9JT62_9PROT|nr:VPLPA-CTERM-specific exosortase XrtD [Methylophilus aquaticus]MDP8567767.1 VPLPA-CTERM-specific exosortase XrtD [Methylophilus aquaticus]